MKVNFRVLEHSLIDSCPTIHMVQIKMDFHCFESSTELCYINVEADQESPHHVSTF